MKPETKGKVKKTLYRILITLTLLIGIETGHHTLAILTILTITIYNKKDKIKKIYGEQWELLKELKKTKENPQKTKDS